MKKPQRLETLDTLAARFALPRRTIVREVMRSRLPYVSIAGSWRFRDRDIEVWLERTGPLPRLAMMSGGLERAELETQAEVQAEGQQI